MKPVGKPDAGNPHVRFDERGGETEPPQAVTAPLLDSTRDDSEEALGSNFARSGSVAGCKGRMIARRAGASSS